MTRPRWPQTTGMTQKQRVLWYMVNIGSIDPLTSWTELGVYRLAARINELRRENDEREAGLQVDEETYTKVVQNQYGEPVMVAEYRLLEENGQKKLF